MAVVSILSIFSQLQQKAHTQCCTLSNSTRKAHTAVSIRSQQKAHCIQSQQKACGISTHSRKSTLLYYVWWQQKAHSIPSQQKAPTAQCHVVSLVTPPHPKVKAKSRGGRRVGQSFAAGYAQDQLSWGRRRCWTLKRARERSRVGSGLSCSAPTAAVLRTLSSWLWLLRTVVALI